MSVTHQSKPLQIAVAVLWDRRRTLPRYAEGFANLLARHIYGLFGRAGPGHARTTRRRTPEPRQVHAGL